MCWEIFQKYEYGDYILNQRLELQQLKLQAANPWMRTTAAEVGSARIAELSNYEGALLNQELSLGRHQDYFFARSAGLTFSQPLDKREAWHSVGCPDNSAGLFIAGFWPQTESGHGGCV